MTKFIGWTPASTRLAGTVVSVTEPILLRSILEYGYRLAYLADIEIGANQRIERAIELSYGDLQAYERLPSELQANSVRDELQFLCEWYGDQRPGKKLKSHKVRDIFDKIGDPDESWLIDKGGRLVNPTYQRGYAIQSAISHGHPWAVRHFGVPKIGESGQHSRWLPGLNTKTRQNCQASAGTILQYSFGLAVQLLRGILDAGTMNKLGEQLARIWSNDGEPNGEESSVADGESDIRFSH